MNYINIKNLILEQKRVVFTILFIITYCITINHLQENLCSNKATKSVFNDVNNAQHAYEVKNISIEQSEMYDYYKQLYGPSNKVVINDYEFDIIPGAPYSIYEAMAAGLDKDKITVIEPIDAAYEPLAFKSLGKIEWNGHTWTWYSEKVLSGGGLDIPGRHVDNDGLICDKDGYICLAADLDYLERGSIIDTPFGRPGKVYDCGCAYGTVDVYVGW